MDRPGPVRAWQENQTTTHPADDLAAAAGEGRGRSHEGSPRRQQAPAQDRPAQRTGRRVLDAGNVVTTGYSSRRDLCSLPHEVANRTRVQTAEILAPYRPTTN